jgi:small conductance mechanosensitive channel
MIFDWTAILEVIQTSFYHILIFTLILLFTGIVVKIVNKLVERSFKKSSKFIKVDHTQYRFVKHLITGVIYILGISLAIFTVPGLRTLSVSLFAGAGILAVIVGFASQAAFSNIVSGVFIAIFKPFRVDDRVSIGTTITGVVEDITLRHTVIRNFENKRIIIPNTVISSEIIENASIEDEKICKFVEFGISYDSDVDLAMKIMSQEAGKHTNVLDNRSNKDKDAEKPMIITRILGFGDSSVNLRAWVWAKNASDAFVMGCDLNKSIKERFDKEGIEIPFPYRTIVYKKDIPKNAVKKKVSKKNL